MARDIVRGLNSGGDISEHRDQLRTLTASQKEKAEIVLSTMTHLDLEALVLAAEMRNSSMRYVAKAMRRHDVSTQETLVAWRMAQEQLPALRKSVAESKAVDSDGAVDRISQTSKKRQAELDDRWAGTTPQGREIIRKRVFAALRERELREGTWEHGMPKPEPEADAPVDSVLDESAPAIEVKLANPP